MASPLLTNAVRWIIDARKRDPSPSSCAPPALSIEPLEPRLLLAADLAGGLALPHSGEQEDEVRLDLHQATAAQTLEADQVVQTGDPRALPDALDLSSMDLLYATHPAPSSADELRFELIFVDAAVDDHQALIASLLAQSEAGRRIEVVVLDSQSDGIRQITDVLADYQDVDAVHLVSHGTAEGIQLGTTWLDAGSAAGDAASLRAWGEALTADADLLLYGCNLAASVEGRALAAQLGALTGADIAASDDLTGAASRGGDWNLEFTLGAVEAQVAFSDQGKSGWDGTLLADSVRDEFDRFSYGGNSGTSLWSGDWQELIEANGPGVGFVYLAGGGDFASNHLSMRAKILGEGASREADLSGADAAVLSFDYQRQFASGGQVDLEVSGDGGGSWTVMDSFDLSSSDLKPVSARYDIGAFVASDTMIRFVVSATDPVSTFSIDNVQIAFDANADGGLWLSTTGNVTEGDHPGLATWRSGDLVEFADPGLELAPGVTAGTVAEAFDVSLFSPGANINAAHLVSADIQIGASGFQLRQGDLLLSVTGNPTVSFSSPSVAIDPGFTNSLDVTKADVFVFRPDVPGDYSAGTFAMLLENLTGDNIRGITLVETNTIVGDAKLGAGDFLFTRGGVTDSDDIWLFDTGDVGAGTTSGTVVQLLEGSDAKVGISDPLFGIELIESAVTLGGTILDSGTILLTVQDGTSVGDNALLVDPQSVFALSIDRTTMEAGPGNGSAQATMLFNGDDVAFDSDEYRLDAVALTAMTSPVVGSTALWLTTESDVSGSGAPGLSDWSGAEVLRFGSPDLLLEPAGTSGTFSSVTDLAALGASSIDALHFVSGNVTIGGTTTVQLLGGDVLFSTKSGATLTNSDATTTVVNADDVVLFRPDAPGDYRSGSFTVLLNSPLDGDIVAVSLVESATFLGDGTLLPAGTFLLVQVGGAGAQAVYHYTPDDVGAADDGSAIVLLDGNGFGLDGGASIDGIAVVANEVSLGGVALTVGQVLLSLDSDDPSTGNNSIAVSRSDIFILDVTGTGVGTSSGNATLLFEGADVSLNSGPEDLVGIALYGARPNAATDADPVASAAAGGPYVISEGDDVTFDGSASSDDGAIVLYEWDLDNDGVYGEAGEPSGVAPTVAWSTLQSYGIDDGDPAGTNYTVRLRVTDDVGQSGWTQFMMTVLDTAPTLITSGTGFAMAGVNYNLSLSVDDPGNETITSWTINWGDGNVVTYAGDPGVVSHPYANEGFTYGILASVINEDGEYFQNDLLVADYDRNSAYRFDGTTGGFLSEFATADGIGRPVQMLVGPDGLLYLSGETSANVLRYDAVSGAFIDEFVSPGDGGLTIAGAMAFGPDGDFYLADGGGDNVLRFDAVTGAFLGEFVSAGAGGLADPYGMTFGPDGNLYVGSWSDSNVLRFDGDTGAFINVFVSSGDGGLFRPSQLAFGSDGHLYVASENTNEVLRYDGISGNSIGDFVGPGSGGLDKPAGLAFGPDGNLYVSDYADGLILRFDGVSGIPIDEYATAGSGGLDGPAFLAFLPEHQVSVVANLPPVASPDDYDVVEDSPLTVLPAIGVLDNDTDAEGDPFLIRLESDVSSGTLTLNPLQATNLANLTGLASDDVHASWSPDGARVAFRSDRDGNPEIYVMDADGANVVRLTNSLGLDTNPAWSPDGTRIAFWSLRDGNPEIYTIHADGTNLKRLTSNVDVDTGASWSPDGTQLLFRSDRDGNGEIYVMDADGGNQTRLTVDAANELAPVWSPDGTRIAFSSNRDGNQEIYVMDADGSNPVRLTSDAATDDNPTWSPDSTRIAFQSNRDGNNEIYLMNADGSGVTRLTNNAADDSVPDWGPNGWQIGFQSARDGNNEIYVMDLFSDGGFTYTPDPDFFGTDSFSYSVSDGRNDSNIVVVTLSVNAVNDAPQGSDDTVVTLEDTAHVFSVADFGFTDVLDGDNLLAVKVTVLPGLGALANNGLSVAAGDYVSVADILAGRFMFIPEPNDNGAGYVSIGFQVQDDGGTAFGGIDLDPVTRTLTIDVTSVNDTPEAADDSYATNEDTLLSVNTVGGLLANDSDEESDPMVIRLISNAANGLLVFRPAGVTNGTNLTSNAFNDSRGVWSPDGTKIVFRSDRDGNDEIYVMDADGSNLARLTSNGAGDVGASWSPDGSRIVFSSDRDGNNEIYVMDADGANQTRLTFDPGTDSAPSWSPDGTRIAFQSTRDGDTELYVMDADGSNPVRLTTSAGIDSTPVWSPDGTRLVFTSERDGQAEIYIVDADGSNPVRLTSNAALDSNATWAPDGSRIAFQSDRDGNPEIYVMDADGSNLTRVTDSPASEIELDWSSDGARLLITTDVDGNDEVYLFDLLSDGAFTYTPDADFNGMDTFRYVTGDGNSESTPATVTLTINPVNDAPSGSNNSIIVDEDGSYAFAASDFGFSDAVDGDALLAVRITMLPAAGTLANNGVAVNAGDFIAVADIIAGRLVFQPAPDGNGPAYADFLFQVQDDGGTANGGVDLDPSVKTMAIDVTAVNDAPVGIDATVATLEDTPYVFSGGEFAWGDLEGDGLLQLRVSSLPGAGVLTLGGLAVNAGDFVSFADMAAGLFVFSPAPNSNGTAYASFTFQLQDDGGTANGGIDLDPTPNTLTIDVTPVNDEPAGANNTVTTLEDTPYVFGLADFGFSDSDGDGFAAVHLASVPASGSLTLSGAATNPGDVVSAADIVAGLLVFTPTSDANGASYASFTFRVQDSGGTANGGIDLDATPNTLTIDVTSVNDAPAGANNTVTTLEDTPYVFGLADFGFSDSDGDGFAAVHLATVPASGSLTLSGAATNPGDVVSAADIAAGLLVFTPTSDANGASYASFTFRVQDSGGTANGGIDLDATPNTLTIDVTPVNDEPAGANNTVTTLEDTPYVFGLADFGFSDSDGDSFAAMRLASVPASGSLTLSGAATNSGDVISAADIAAGLLVFTPTSDANGASYASFTFRVQDSGGTANGGIDLDPTPNTLTIDVTPVNDEPAGANNTVTTLEDTPYVFGLADFGFSDSDGDSFAAVHLAGVPASGSLTLSGAATNPGDVISAADIAAGLLVFTPAPDANGSGYASVTFRVQDSGGTANGGIDLDATPNTLTIDVTSVNDAPAGANNTVTTLEDAAYVFGLADFGFSDSESDDFAAVHLSSVPFSGSLTLSGAATNSDDVISAADIAAGLLVFTPTSDANGASYASFTFRVQDSGGTANGGIDLDATPNTLTIDVTPVNDEPAGANNTVTTLEDTPYVFGLADFGFSDSDGDSFAAVHLAGVPASGSLTLSGAATNPGDVISAADIAAGLLVFTPAPDANGSGYASVTFRVQDSGGTANGGIDLDATPNTLTIDVTSVNDAPAGANNTVTTLEDTPYVFGLADFGFSDSDGDGFAAVHLATVPASGSLTLGGTASNPGDVVSTTDIAAGLLVFTPTSDANGASYASFTFRVQDSGGTANGGIDLDATPNTLTIDVTPVNDEPAGANNTVSTLEDTPYVFGLADFGFSDSDGDSFAAMRLASVPASGSLTLSGAATNPGDVISAADIAAGLLVFTPAPDANGSGYASVTFRVQDSGGTANGGIDLDATPNTLTIDVTSVNDAPAGANNTVTTLEDTPYVFSLADFGFSDSEGDSFAAIHLASVPASGSLTLSGAATNPGDLVSAADIAAGLLVFDPAPGASGIAYASFSVHVQDDGGTANGGTDIDATASSITIDVTDTTGTPSGADSTVVIAEDSHYVFILADFGFSDPADGDSLLAVRITTLPSAGSLALGGTAVGAGDYLAATDIAAGLLTFAPATDASGSAYASFTFQVQDDGASNSLDLSPNTLTVDVTPVNDAPAGANRTVTTLEETPYTFSIADFGFTDSEPDNFVAVHLASLPASGSLTLSGAATNPGDVVSVADIVAGLLVFTPASDASGASYASFTFRVQDSGGTANGGIHLDPTPNTLTIDVTSVNDAPDGANSTVTTLEDTPYVFGLADFGFSDSDGDGFAAVHLATVPASGSLTLSGAATNPGDVVSAADIAAGLLVFDPAPDANGAGYASLTFRVQDSAGTANGGIDLDATPNTLTIDVTPVNDAPAGANTTVTILEDTPHVFSLGDFGFSDSDGDSLAAVHLVSGPAKGSLTLSGTAASPGDVLSTADIAAGLLVFTPAPDANGAGYAQFLFRVQDGGGTANGGVNLDPVPRRIGIDVTPVNDAPAGANATVTTLEDTPYTFSVADFGFTDNEPDNFDAVHLASVPASGSLTLGGTATNPGDVVSTADIAAGLLVFTPAPDASGASYASVTFRVQDSGGTANGGIDLDATPNTLTIDVTPVNDAPAGANSTVTALEDTPYVFGLADFGFSDSDGDGFAAVHLASVPASGSLTLSGAATNPGDVISAADIAAGLLVFDPAPGASGIAYASFSVHVQDDGGTANGGTDIDATASSITIDVTDTTGTPSGADSTVVIAEDSHYVFILADFGFSDPADGDNLLAVRITTLPSAGSLALGGTAVGTGDYLAATDIAAGLLTFAPATDASGSAYASFTFQVQDDGASNSLDLSPNTLTVDVTPVNDAPAGANRTVTTLEETPYTFSIADFGFTDSEPDNFVAVHLASLPASGSLTLSGAATNPGDVVSAADIVAGLLVFTPASDASGASYASFTFRVQDSGGTANGGIDLDPTPNTLTIDVTSVNDAPDGANSTVSTLEDTPYVFDLADFGFSDSEGDSFAAVHLASLPASGWLTLSGALTNAGDLIDTADIAAGLLVFTPVPDDSGASYASFTFRVQDSAGTANGGIDLDPTPDTLTIDVTPVNDAPAGASSTVTTLEDAPYTFSVADFGFTDGEPDNFVAVHLTSLPASGLLTLSGAATNPGDVVSTADIAAGLLVFTPAPDANGSGYASFTFRVQDSGGTANGGIDLDATPNTLTIDVTPVNDAPSLGDASLEPLDEDSESSGQAITDLFANTFSDADAGASLGGLVVIANSADPDLEGIWEYSSDGVTWSQVGTGLTGPMSLALRADALLRFLPADNFNGPVSALGVLALDDSYAGPFSQSGVAETRVILDSSVRGGTTAIASDPSQVNASVTAVNDLPVNTGSLPAGIRLGNGGFLSDLASIELSDVDSDTLKLTLRSTSGGTMSATGSDDVQVSGSGTSTLVLAGSPEALNAYLNDPLQVAYFNGLDALSQTDDGIEGNEQRVDRLDIAVTDPNEPGGPDRQTVDLGGFPVVTVSQAGLTPTPVVPETPLVPVDPGAAEVTPETARETTGDKAAVVADPQPDSGLEPEQLLTLAQEIEPLVAFPSPPLGQTVTMTNPTTAADKPTQPAPDDAVVKILKDALRAGVGFLDVARHALPDLPRLLTQSDFIRALDNMREQATEGQATTVQMVASSVAVSSGLTIGYVAWIARGGMLIASLASSMPAWRVLDPLPVLSRFQEKSDDENAESLQSMVRGDDESPDSAREADESTKS